MTGSRSPPTPAGSDAFDDALVEYAAAYADRNHEDYTAFLRAIADGVIESRLG